MVTVSGFGDGTISTTFASVTRKLLVAPESIMAQSFRYTWLEYMVRRRFCTYGVTLHPKSASVCGSRETDGASFGIWHTMLP